MKKNKLFSLVLMGMSVGLLATGCQKATADEDMSPEMKSFYEQLEPNAQQKFMQLDEKHKKMALDSVQAECSSAQDCKGVREKAVEEQYQHQMQGTPPSAPSQKK